jgi:hypothetical protein
MISSSNLPRERGLDAMLIVSSILDAHPASTASSVMECIALDDQADVNEACEYERAALTMGKSVNSHY